MRSIRLLLFGGPQVAGPEKKGVVTEDFFILIHGGGFPRMVPWALAKQEVAMPMVRVKINQSLDLFEQLGKQTFFSPRVESSIIIIFIICDLRAVDCMKALCTAALCPFRQY